MDNVKLQLSEVSILLDHSLSGEFCRWEELQKLCQRIFVLKTVEFEDGWTALPVVSISSYWQMITQIKIFYLITNLSVYIYNLTSDSKQLYINLSQLNKNLFEMDYIDDLTNVFINQWNMSRFKKRSRRFGLEWWLKETIIFYPTLKLSSNLYIATWIIKSLDIKNLVETYSFDSFVIFGFHDLFWILYFFSSYFYFIFFWWTI